MNLGESLEIAIFCMATVFLILGLLWAVIKGFSFLFSKKLKHDA